MKTTQALKILSPMREVHLACALLLSCSLASVDAVQTAGVLYKHPLGLFSFKRPAKSKVVLGDQVNEQGSKKDTITVVQADGKLAVRLFKLPLVPAIKASDNGLVAQDKDGKWYRSGRFDTKGSAVEVKYGALSGFYAVATCGISDSNGFHAAAGQCLSGYLSDGKQTAYFETEGIYPVDDVEKMIMPSFSFGAVTK